jgi:hypothetical protein
MASAAAQFDEDAKGRYPLSENMGAAKTWTAEGHPPRPDRTMSMLRFLSAVPFTGVLGIDHFYLRSPLTGIAKLLTLGGFGIWWLWDALQVHTESERVVKYGLSLPFDLKLGIGQGMIVEGPTHYEQRSAFSWWQVAALFGFTGADSFLMGKWGQGARKVVEFIFLLVGIISVVSAFHSNGISGLLTFGKIISILLIIFFGMIVFGNWGLSLKSIFSTPDDLFTNGIRVPAETGEVLNSYTAILDKIKWIIGDGTVIQVKKDMNYGTVDGEELKKRFSIERSETLRQEEKSSPPPAEDGEKQKWLWSFLIWIGLLPLFFVQLLVFIGKGIFYFFFPMKAATDVLAGASVAEAEAEAARRIAALHPQGGGARKTELSTEALVLGASVIAIIGGGALKAVVDNIVAE